MKMKNNLDEGQELKLLQIEHRGYWLAFGALFLSMIIQTSLGIDSFKDIASEFIIFILLAGYMLIACMKHGIWDRRLKPTRKTNIIVSIIAGTAVAILYFFITYYRYQKIYGSIATAIFMFLFTTIPCYLLLVLFSKLYQRRIKKIESAIEDDMEEDLEK